MKRDSERIFDEYLVTAARLGERDAIERLVARWQPRLLRHAWRLTGDVELAKDMTQEGWIEILRSLPRLDDVVAFPAWAYRIITRRCQRLFHRTSREPWGLELQEDDAALAMSEDRALDVAIDATRAMAAIATLPPLQRTALALFYTEELSVAEISVALDVPPGTVKTRLMHARRKVRALLEGDTHGQD